MTRANKTFSNSLNFTVASVAAPAYIVAAAAPTVTVTVPVTVVVGVDLALRSVYPPRAAPRCHPLLFEALASIG